ncbi:MAG TPA: ClbS/DfsB family four-helix bundle protein [Chloroflexia bacterium]
MTMAQRIAANEALVGKYTLVPAGELSAIIDRIQRFRTAHRQEAEHGSVYSHRADVADLDLEQLRAVLRSLHPGVATVIVVWPADRLAARLQYADFVACYDDLWHPASTDVWITDQAVDWLVELDHEETLTVLREDPETESPLTKAALLNRLHTEHARLTQSMGLLTEAQLTQPGIIGTWSVKDMLPHIMHWEQFALAELEPAMCGERPAAPADGSGDAESEDEINARVVAQYRDVPLEAVRAAFDRSFERVVAVVEALGEAEFAPSSPVAQALGEPVVDCLGNNTYEHYAEHSAMIRDWLARHKAAG